MNYVLRLFLSFIIIFSNFSGYSADALGLDSVYTTPNNPFISKIIALKHFNTKISLSKETSPLPLSGTILAANGQVLIKNREDIYIIILQTGFVYKLTNYDSVTCVYRRIDHTINLNYNINCKTFFYQNQLYSYGGYGFWKTNGHLRKFNFEDSEWDIIPTNNEIISTQNVWFSEEQGKLYVPFQRIINAGIEGAENIRGIPDFSSYTLNLKTHKWEKIGDLEGQAKELFASDVSSNSFLDYKDGLLHLVHDGTYLFDFVHNKMYKSKNADLNQFLIRRAAFENMFIYNGGIYSYNLSNKTFNVYPFRITDFELIKSNMWGSSMQLYYILTAIAIITILIVCSIWFFNQSVKRKLEAAQLKILKTKTVTQAFSATEVSLINLLLTATLKNENVEIYQINHVLGIKDKNIGLQKKVRSDVMKAINDKYEFITQANIGLIGSSRKIDDKRFYEYFINLSEVKTIQRILENNTQ
jgi:hypothetical protein